MKNLCSSAQDATHQQSQHHYGAREEATTFENWFGMRVAELPTHLQALKPRRQIMVHAQPRSREMSKTFPATVYMSDQFPMSVRSVCVAPLLLIVWDSRLCVGVG